MTSTAAETAAAESKAAMDSDNQRWTYGLIAVGIGLVVILIALLIVTNKFDTAADVGTVMGVVVSPIGTIVAAYFGVAAGSSGKAKSDDNAKKATKAAITMAAAMPPDQAQEIVRNLF
jgi:uncharacterized integral membrane protein